MALWSNKTVQVPGLTATYASSGPITAESRRHYILDTTSNTITVNLPTGVDGYSIRISDAKGTFLTNNVIVVPSTGQKINKLTINESFLLDVNEMWIELTWNALAGSWILNAPGVLGLIADSFSDYPYITSPASPAASTLRLYAKSDGKLYTKDSAGSEQKVGGGLDHPTTGSTFEGGIANPSMTGASNTAIGVTAADSLTTGYDNVAIGTDAMTLMTDGNSNVAIGKNALNQNISGFYNVAIGLNAGDQFVSDANSNTIINTPGAAGTSLTYSGVVAIGRDTLGLFAAATASNQFVLGTSNHIYRFPGIAQTSLVLGPTGTSTGQTGVIRVRELAANGTNSVGFRAADSIVADVTWTLPAAAGTNGQLLTTDGAGVLSWSTVGASNSTILVTQNSHGFVAADIGRPLYLNGSTYTFAQADTEAKAEVAGIINSIVDTNNFRLCLAGEVSSVGANLIVGGGALTPGEMYFLSASDTGKISVTPPSVVGQISKPVGIARTSSALDFFNMRGSAVGGTNVYTQIGLTNNAVTTIQNAAAYDSVELSGWVYINATTPLRFAIKVQVTKNGAGNNYLTSFQTSGDTPPSGFDVDATAAGLVQITLPSIAGFTAAVVQFNLNGPAVGASLPLQIDSSSVSFGTVQAKDSSGITFKENNGSNTFTINDSGIARSFGGFDKFSAGINSGKNVLRTYRCEGTITPTPGSTFDLLQNVSAYDDIILIYSIRLSAGYNLFKTGFCIFGGYGGYVNSLDGSSGENVTLENAAVSTGIGKLRLKVVNALPISASGIFEINCFIISAARVTALNGILSE